MPVSPALRFVSRFVLPATLLLAAACGGSDESPTTASSGSTGGAGGTGGSGGTGGVAQIPMPEGELLSFPVDGVGPFNVGYRTWKITYQSPGQSEPREIGFHVWYPTLDADGPHPVYLKLFQDPDVIEDASLAPPVEAAGYPVHVYSHGSYGFAGTSADMMHYFASHGWVAVAPDHTGNTLGIPADKHTLSIFYLRSTDVSAALDELEKLDASDPLAGKCRTGNVVMSGHSFGTLTTWASGGATFDLAAIQAKCDNDEFAAPCKPEELAVFAGGVADARVVAGIPLAGDATDWFTPEGYNAVNKPYMLMTGSADVSGQGVFDLATSIDFTWLEFEGGCHQLFALGGCAEFDTALGYSLVNTYTLAFARTRMLGDASDQTAKILSGETVLSDKVTLLHEGPVTPPAKP